MEILFVRAYAGPELVRAPDSRQGGLRKYEETPRGEILQLLFAFGFWKYEETPRAEISQFQIKDQFHIDYII